MNNPIILGQQNDQVLLDIQKQFPPIEDGTLIVIPFTGGMDSYLCALIAKSIYGIDNIVFVFVPIFSKLLVNHDKRHRVESDFLRGLKRIGASKHCVFTKDLLDPHKSFGTNMLEYMRSKYKAERYKILLSYTRVQMQNYKLMLDSGWNLGKRTTDELRKYFDEHCDNYPELNEYIKVFGGELHFTDHAWENLYERFTLVNMPFKELSAPMMVQLYEKLGYLSEIYDTISCNDTKYDCDNYDKHTHCGVCKSCLERKNAFKVSGIEDKTKYKE